MQDISVENINAQYSRYQIFFINIRPLRLPVYIMVGVLLIDSLLQFFLSTIFLPSTDCFMALNVTRSGSTWISVSFCKY